MTPKSEPLLAHLVLGFDIDFSVCDLIGLYIHVACQFFYLYCMGKPEFKNSFPLQSFRGILQFTICKLVNRRGVRQQIAPGKLKRHLMCYKTAAVA